MHTLFIGIQQLEIISKVPLAQLSADIGELRKGTISLSKAIESQSQEPLDQA